MARIRLLRGDEAPAETRDLFGKIEARGGTVLNLYRAVGYSPAAASAFLKLGNVLLRQAELSPRLRELAILRIAVLLGSDYEWAQHVPIAREVGVSDQQVNDIRRWDRSPGFTPEERAVLAYTDEVTREVKVRDETFDALRSHLSERSIVELTLSIGYWGMVARVLVPLAIEIEDRSVGSVGDLIGKRKGGD